MILVLDNDLVSQNIPFHLCIWPTSGVHRTNEKVRLCKPNN